MLIDAGIDVNAQDIVSCCYNYMLVLLLELNGLTFGSQCNDCLNSILDRGDCFTQCSSDWKRRSDTSPNTRRS